MALIERDVLIKRFCGHCIDYGKRIEKCFDVEIIESIPPVDAVPVIRCKDCAWHKEKRCTVWRERAVIVECYTDDFGYCYLAKEKENE